MLILVLRICTHVKLGILEPFLCVYVCVGCIFLCCISFFSVLSMFMFFIIYAFPCCIKSISLSATVSYDVFLVFFVRLETFSSPRWTIFLHVLSFECTSKMCIIFPTNFQFIFILNKCITQCSH